jgi:twitching motility two-component system response regulator PilH
VVDAIRDPSSFREVLPPGGKYDLVLVDLFMPGMDGIEVLQRFSSDVRNCASRLYVITASDNPALRLLAQRSGADGYLTKPLTRNSLLELLA